MTVTYTVDFFFLLKHFAIHPIGEYIYGLKMFAILDFSAFIKWGISLIHT